MQRRLGDALAVYVDAMRYPRGTEDQRASMWLEHTRRHGWKGVAAVEVPDHGDSGDVSDHSAPALAAASGGRPASGRRRQDADRGADDQLLRADRVAHRSPRAGPWPRRGVGAT